MNVRSLTSLLLVLFLSFSTLFAAPEPAPTGTVGGKLLDQESKSPLDNVTVFIYQGTSDKPFKVANTDEKGVFIFSDVLPGEYRVEAGFLGYLPFEEVVQVMANQQTHLGEIVLKNDAKALRVVEVTGLRSTMKLEVDKRVFSVDQSVAAAGASTSDILKNIPSVEVDAEGTVSLRNSTNVIIWINGKPSGLTADNQAQVLEQMPAESIDRIEVITNPSAKYSAEGSAGIINIILKKDRKAGYYGSLRAGVSTPIGYNFGGNVNYSSPKWDLYANLGTRAENREGDGSTNRETYSTVGSTTTTEYMNSTTKRNMTHGGLFFRAGADYHINDQHTISLSGFGMNGNRDFSSDVYYNYFDTDKLPTAVRQRTSTENGGHNNYEMELDYQWEIGPEHNLHAILSAGKEFSPETSNYTQFDVASNNSTMNLINQDGKGSENEDGMEFQLDYTRKFSEKWKLEAGWKTNMENRLSDDLIRNLNGSVWTPFSQNLFDYHEQIHAAYATLTGKLTPKLGYQLGLRGEQTIVDFTSTNVLTNTVVPHEKNYLKLFPTIFANYTISEGSDLQLNYSRRINRPRGRALNPFVNISDSTNIWVGNPNLDPEYSNNFEMNFLKTWTNHTLSAALYHRISEQVIQDIRYLDNGVMNQTPENVTNSTSSGLELVAKDKLFKILETTTTLNLYQQSMDGFTYRGQTYDGTNGFSWNLRMNGQMALPWAMMGQVSGFYSAPRIVAQGTMKAAYSLDLGLRKSFLDRTLQVSLNGQNLLNSFKFENITTGPGFSQVTSNQFFGRTIRLNVTWNFGNLKPKEKEDKGGNQDNTGGGEGDF
jgi:outer membrane receptor protein involved in Fe transport